jgi:hypothetical protein
MAIANLEARLPADKASPLRGRRTSLARCSNVNLEHRPDSGPVSAADPQRSKTAVAFGWQEYVVHLDRDEPAASVNRAFYDPVNPLCRIPDNVQGTLRRSRI